MYSEDSVYIGKSQKQENLLLKLANRHGLIAGATGTGKTVSLQILAEGFAADGVPVFCADVKGDLAGLAVKGEAKDFLTKRAQDIGYDGYEMNKFPVVFWDLFGEQGHPIRTTISDMGPLLLSRLLNLNETQEGVINVAFRVADDEGGGGAMGAMAAMGKLNDAGLDTDQITGIGKTLLGYVGEQGGQDLVGEIVGSIPGLDRLI